MSGETNKSSVKKECLKCGKPRDVNKSFYMSDSSNHMDHKYPICKMCIKSSLKLDDPYSQEAIESVKDTLLDMNRPFIFSLWITSIEESEKTNREVFGLYIKNVVQNKRTATWKDSEFSSTPSSIENNVEIIDKKDIDEVVITVNNRDKEDVIRMLGYDPFDYENEEDRVYLYSNLISFLDDSSLEDGFKLQAQIEIVRGFNQIDKINRAITQVTNDVNKMTNSSGGIKSLISSKKDILASLLKLAEDNGISVKHNNQKSKGAGTLSGIIKTLQEKGIEEGELNLFDVETAHGIKQVADLSNKSIMAQLQFDENDYTGMVLEQREMIQELDSKVIKLDEENRLLKKEILKYQKIDGDENG